MGFESLSWLNRTRTKRVPRAQHGFALVLALTTMSFVLLLLLLMTTLVKVETGASAQQLSQLQARQNALLGLMIALGDLQKHVGPDQRVTARAEILGTLANDDPRRFWIGAWDTRDMNARPRWLVSGLDTDPEGSDTDLTILGTETLGQSNPESFVEVPAVGIPGGRIAWWVSDESNKVNLTSSVRYNTPDLTAMGQANRLNQIRPNRFRFETQIAALDNNSTSDITPDLIETLNQTLGFKQLALVAGINPSDLNLGYHNLTTLSYSVLSDTHNGGLRRDLSAPNFTDANSPIPLTPDFFDKLNRRLLKSEDAVEFRGIRQDAPESITTGEVVDFAPLVFTEIGIYFGVFRYTGSASNDLKLHVTFRADVWNPYATSLYFSPAGNTDIFIRVEGLPEVEAFWETGRGRVDSGNGQFSFNLEDFSYRRNNAPSGPRHGISEIPLDIFGALLPGEVRTIAQRFTDDLNVTMTDPTSNNYTDDFIRLVAPGTELTITIEDSNGNMVKQFVDIPFEGFDTLLFGERNLRPAINANSNPLYANYQAVFHFKFADETTPFPDTGSDMERWSEEFDVRTITYDFASESNILEMILLTENPGFASVSENVFSERPELFFGGNGGSERSFYRFFDFASLAPVSVGHIGNFKFQGIRPQSIGNTWGDQMNRIFDQWYFSAPINSVFAEGNDVEGNNDDSNPLTLPDQEHIKSLNHRITRLPKVDDLIFAQKSESVDSAEVYLLRGGFNLNSTSIPAWISVLSANNLYDWSYRRNESVAEIIRPRVTNGLFRFSFLADRTFIHPSQSFATYPNITNTQRSSWYRLGWQPDWARAYTVGMREIRDVEIQQLAEEIVSRLKDNGRPFSSIAEMINSGIIQNAINSTTINTVSGESYDESPLMDTFPRGSASYLSQADVFNHLGSFSFVRGDTFVVRGFGEVSDPINGQAVANAFCEVVVQRIPKEQDNNNFGRQFKIHSFRWLEN